MEITEEDYSEQFVDDLHCINCNYCAFEIQQDFPLGMIDEIVEHISSSHPNLYYCEECNRRLRSSESKVSHGVILCSDTCVEARMFPYS